MNGSLWQKSHDNRTIPFELENRYSAYLLPGCGGATLAALMPVA